MTQHDDDPGRSIGDIKDIASQVIPGWVQDISSAATMGKNLITNPKAALLALLTTSLTFAEAKNRLEVTDQSLVVIIVDEFLYQMILRPIAEAIWEAGLSVISAIMFIIYGGNHRVGIADGSFAGAADLPILLLDPFSTTITDAYTGVADTIGSMNDVIRDAALTVGLPAPIVVNIIYGIVIFGSMWGMYVLISSVDIPLINEVSFIKTLTAPFRRVIDYIT